MGIDDFIHHAREVVRSTVPSTVQITNIEFEGPMVVIYTKSLEQFANNNDIVRQLAQALRRRVSVRPDPSILADTDRAETEINRAGSGNVYELRRHRGRTWGGGG